MTGDDLARSLLLVADDLDGKGYPLVGVLRVAARALADGQPLEDGDDYCASCGATFTQPPTGRPRRYCYTCSPPRKTPAKDDNGA